MKKLALLLTACLVFAPLTAKEGDQKKGKKAIAKREEGRKPTTFVGTDGEVWFF